MMTWFLNNWQILLGAFGAGVFFAPLILLMRIREENKRLQSDVRANELEKKTSQTRMEVKRAKEKSDDLVSRYRDLRRRKNK